MKRCISETEDLSISDLSVGDVFQYKADYGETQSQKAVYIKTSEYDEVVLISNTDKAWKGFVSPPGTTLHITHGYKTAIRYSNACINLGKPD